MTNPRFHQVQLDNGLTVIAESNDHAHTAAVGFFVKTGTRDESPELMGVSHFLEHMMFKGTQRRSADDVNREFDRIGANYNASTSQEITNYYAHILPRFMPAALDLLTDMLRPSLREEDYEMERNVILEEIGMYADRPFWTGYETAMELYYGHHPLGYRILGTQQTIRDLKRDQMMDYFQTHYAPDNMFISLAGRIDFEGCLRQIDQATRFWKPAGITRRHDPHNPTPIEHLMRKSDVARHYVIVLCPAPSRQDDFRYASAVLGNLIGDCDGSLLYWSLIDPGYADEAEFSPQPFDRNGSYLTFASCDPERAEKVERILLETLDGALSQIDGPMVERAKSKIAMDITLQGERPAGRMMSLAGSWLDVGQYRPLEDELLRVMAVDEAEIRRLLTAFPFKPRTVLRLTPDA